MLHVTKLILIICLDFESERERELVCSCFSFNLFVISLSEQMSQFLWNTLKLRGTHEFDFEFIVFVCCVVHLT